MLSHAENVFLLESFYKTGSVNLTQNEFRRRFGKEVDRRTVYRLSVTPLQIGGGKTR